MVANTTILTRVIRIVIILTASVLNISESSAQPRVLNAGFVAVDGVYNSELMAPYDILHHSVFRDRMNFVAPFVVSPDGSSITTFEGLEVGAHYGFDNAPDIDILVIPSAEGSMTSDLQNETLLKWIKQRAEEADYVITLCDGAFVLAATGLLDGRNATTFPADQNEMAGMFPDVKVHDDVNFVVDGKFITSVGGALSYEPALYLLEVLYSERHAVETAAGLVLDWPVPDSVFRVITN